VSPREFERLEFVGDDRQHAVDGPLQYAANNQRGTFAGHWPKRFPEPARTHDIDDSGFVFEVEEGDALRGSGALSVRDETGDFDSSVGFGSPQIRDGQHPAPIQFVPHKLDGVQSG
jgi:hypothetical protein